MASVIDFLVGFLLIFWSIIYSIIAAWFPKKYFHKDVKGQVVLVTGGGSGFGRQLAKKFGVDHGATVVIWDINQKGMDETAKLVKNGGGKCFSYLVDVASREQIYAAVVKVEAEVGKVDILINNAGIGDGQYLMETKDEYIEKVFNINILAHFWLTKALLPAMVSARRGHVVTIASSAGLSGVARLSTYCATKHAAVGFHESLTNELELAYPEAKIETTVICPYFVRTGIIAGKEDELPPDNAFLPIRETEPVVDEMMDAILTNQRMLIPAWGIRVLMFLKWNLPSPVIQTLSRILLKFPMPAPKKIK